MLAQRQLQFMAEVTASDDGPDCSSLGMGIYRNAYRGRLAEALGTSFERTQRWVGSEMFDAATAHFILTHPPRSWTLDAYGAHFPEVLAELFADDPEVAELAWLEWHMQQAFAAPDAPELTATALAEAGLAEADWEGLRLLPAAGLTWRAIAHDLAPLWHTLAEDAHNEPGIPDSGSHVLLVWRQGFSPRFRLLDPAEFAALEPLLAGQSFGAAAMAAGEAGLEAFAQWFALWLGEGLFSAIRPQP